MQFAQRCVWGGWKPHKYWVFPHYMWGYIGKWVRTIIEDAVPSLYVRVYRIFITQRFRHISSLIICEGISLPFMKNTYLHTFPHYMWGYIGFWRYVFILISVPSLYVRVYRAAVAKINYTQSSLIICEGISSRPGWIFSMWQFPHYMWGYIVISGQFAARRPVPSLHVSVYRNRQRHPSGIKKYKCSWR